jgi:hypothetical protein
MKFIKQTLFQKLLVLSKPQSIDLLKHTSQKVFSLDNENVLTEVSNLKELNHAYERNDCVGILLKN